MASPGVALDTSGACRLLTGAFGLEVERRQEDIHHAEAQLRAALKELELARSEEERQLARRQAALQRDYESRMARLERRFLSEAEALQNQLKEGVEREAQRCQAALDGKARELLGSLGGSSIVKPNSGGVGSGSSTVRSTPTASLLSAATSPAPVPRAAKTASPAARAKAATPSPAVAAASEAIAALRVAMPPAAGAASQSLAGSLSVRVPKVATSPAAHRPCLTAGGSASPLMPVPPPGLPNTAAAMRATLVQSPTQQASTQQHLTQPPLQQPQQRQRCSVSFADGRGAAGAAPGQCPLPSRQQQQQQTGQQGQQVAQLQASPANKPAALAPAQPAPAPPQLPTATLAGVRLDHESSSEFEDDSWIENESSGELDLAASRPPLVKMVNPGTPRSLSFTSLSAAGGAGISRPGSSGGRAVHLNLAASACGGGGGSPRVRAYSLCNCREGPAAAASPSRGSMLQGAFGRAARYSSD